MTSVRRLTHLGLCVSDLETSLAFYTEAFEFVEVRRFEGEGPAVGQILGLSDETLLQAVYLDRDGWCLELLHYPKQGSVGDGAPCAMNGLGFTHLSFAVRDLDVVCATVRARGGRVLDDSLTEFDTGTRGIFVVDPDGARIELMERGDSPLAIPGQPRD
jgi:glyoxylase I family protein